MLIEGDILGPYQIQKRIRGGGMATLFLAERPGARGFARHLAIKVVNDDLAMDDGFVDMFIDEAKLAAQISHPNVVHVEDFGEVDGKFFIAMEYVHGCSLAQLLYSLVKEQRRLTPELAVFIALKVAEGLHAAHEATGRDGEPLHVVHRDVNPANVLLAYKGHVKLIDFGIAKSASRSHHTTGGSLKGKLRYMSPEQATGKDLDRRADVYALGVTLWETLTGRRLFEGHTDMEVLEAVRSPNIEPPSRFAADVSMELDQVVMSALHPAASARTPTALEVRKQLTRALPEAAMLESSTLAELLATVMRKDIEKHRKKLPDALAAGTAEAPIEPDDVVLRTMTISDIGIEADDSLEPTSVSNTSPLGSDQPSAPAPEEPDSSIVARPPAPPVARPVGTPADLVAPSKPWRWPVLAGGAGLAALLLALAIYGVGTADDKSLEGITVEHAATGPVHGEPTPGALVAIDGPASNDSAAVVASSDDAGLPTVAPVDMVFNGSPEPDASLGRAGASPSEPEGAATGEPEPRGSSAPATSGTSASSASSASSATSRHQRDRPTRMATMTGTTRRTPMTPMTTIPPVTMTMGIPALIDDVF